MEISYQGGNCGLVKVGITLSPQSDAVSSNGYTLSLFITNSQRGKVNHVV